MTTWPPGASLVPLVIEITVSPTDGHLTHVGLGYHVVLNGEVIAEAGYTWHSPDGNFAHGPAAEVQQLQAHITQFQAAARADLASKWPGAALVPGIIRLHPDASGAFTQLDGDNAVQVPSGEIVGHVRRVETMEAAERSGPAQVDAFNRLQALATAIVGAAK